MSTRRALRAEIEATRDDFHRLLNEIPDDALRRPSDNPAWTIGQVLYHMSLAPRFLPADVRMIAGRSRLARLVPRLIPKGLFDWLNAAYTRLAARRLTRQRLRAAYDRAHAETLRALDAATDEDFTRSARYPDWDPLLTGEVSLIDLFGYVRRHFDSHAAQIRRALRRPL